MDEENVVHVSAYICVHMAKLKSAIKENEILSFAGKWVEMEATVR